ncbi:MAG: 4Fe-4S binding protein [Chloroflexi bacterium]|nr:4Fe-4S binding protein [Chloroflexota bacterium]
MPAIEESMPEADHFSHLQGHGTEIYVAWADPGEENLLGYVGLGEASGYGGPMLMAVAVTPEGEVMNAVVISHKETPSWMTRVLGTDFISDLVGKPYGDPFELGNDVDGITSATYTSRAIAESVHDGARQVAVQEGWPVDAKPKPKFVFGIPEITLLALFAVGYFGHTSGFKYKKQARWGSMIVGMVVLGFMYNSPLTLSSINKFLMGFFPQWQTNLYWYILILGIIFVFSVDNKNPYCEWFCPFGAAQECMGVIGGAKPRSPGKYRTFLKWLQRGLAWGAILIALLLRNPGITSYEIFGTLFDLVGSSFQFALLGIILIASMFIRRPWCAYLCPLHPVDEFVRMTRKWILGLWPKRKTTN